MPAYKTHAIHGEIILPEIEKKTEIKVEDFKTYCFGPDSLTMTDYKTFSYQHKNQVRLYFETILSYIKENKLQDNSEVMAFLYGQLDHYIVDIICHPLIIYMTEALPKLYAIKPHALVEMWIDEYLMEKYEKKENFYFHKWHLKDRNLKELIDATYKQVYGVSSEAFKYSIGITFMNLFDSLVRTNIIGITPIVSRMLSLGNFTYNNLEKVLQFLNVEHKVWTHPITGEELSLSFDDLWRKSVETSLEAICDINRHIYGGKPLTQNYIINNCSYNTGFPCEDERKPVFVKKYKEKTY